MMQGLRDVMTKCTMGSATSTIEPTNQMSFRKVDTHSCYWASTSIDFSEKSSLEFFSESIINDNPGVKLLCKWDWGCLVRDKSPPSSSWTWMVWISVLIFTSKLPKDCVCCLDAEIFCHRAIPTCSFRSKIPLSSSRQSSVSINVYRAKNYKSTGRSRFSTYNGVQTAYWKAECVVKQCLRLR